MSVCTVAVFGDYCSDASLGGLKAANEKMIPLISAASTSPRLSTANDYFFRYAGAFLH